MSGALSARGMSRLSPFPMFSFPPLFTEHFLSHGGTGCGAVYFRNVRRAFLEAKRPSLFECSVLLDELFHLVFDLAPPALLARNLSFYHCLLLTLKRSA